VVKEREHTALRRGIFMWSLRFAEHLVVGHSGPWNQLADGARPSHALVTFVVTDADAAAIRTAFYQGGEFAAAVELRRRLPGVPDNARAREYARTIAAWKPLPPPEIRRRSRLRSASAPQADLEGG
jgi:hypothetical protein